MKLKSKYIVGIDEVGRGPLAGPVAVGAVVLFEDFNKSFFKGIKDSKKLSFKQREEWFEKIKKVKKEGKLDYAVSFSSALVIDKTGIVKTIERLIERSLTKLKIPKENSIILLDGGLKAPLVFKNQKTIIKGDEKEMVIGMASIVAKVARDKKMINFSKDYIKYGFNKNMGYGTRNHIEVIKKLGPTDIHRFSYIKNFLDNL